MPLGTVPIDLDVVHDGTSLAKLTIDIPLHAGPVETHEDGSPFVPVKGPTAREIERAVFDAVAKPKRPRDHRVNRYIENGILDDLDLGLSVLIAAPREAEARELFNAVVAGGIFETVRRTNGDLRATTTSGARLHAIGANTTGARGVSVDVLVLLSARAFTSEQRADLAPTIEASPVGEILAF